MHRLFVRRMSETTEAPHTEKIRLPKKKVALVVAYDGSHFMGSQYSPHVPSESSCGVLTGVANALPMEVCNGYSGVSSCLQLWMEHL